MFFRNLNFSLFIVKKEKLKKKKKTEKEVKLFFTSFTM